MKHTLQIAVSALTLTLLGCGESTPAGTSGSDTGSADALEASAEEGESNGGEAAQIDPADITASPGKTPGPAVHLFQNCENLAAQNLVIHGTGR